MAYHLANKKGTTTKVDRNALVTLTSIERLIEEKLSSKDFYELEPVEVLQVGRDGADLDDNSYDYAGGILGRYVFSQHNRHKDLCNWFRPLNPNINALPAKHELVLGLTINHQNFFISGINFFGNPHQNKQPLSRLEKEQSNLKLGDYLTRIDDFRKLALYEGDVLFEGRFQNSIRLSSDIKNDNQESPNIILTAGHLINGDTEQQKAGAIGDGRRERPIFENIDDDGSTIYLSTNEELKFTSAVDSKVDGAFGPFEGKNILLDSDRIIFNTKNGGSIAMLSSSNIALASVTSVVIESPSIKIGSTEAAESMVLGDTLVEIIDEILQAIQAMTHPTGVGPSGPPVNAAKFAGISAKLKTMLSVKTKVE